MLTFNSFGLSLVLGGFMVLSSCSSEPKSALVQPSSMAKMGSFATSKARISFKIKGTGSKGISVKIGVGSSVGYGSCCSTVSPYTTSGFSGNVGDLVYDGDTKRVIVKIYDDLEGTTVDLKDYY